MTKKQLEDSFVALISSNAGIVYKICNIYANSNTEKEDLKQEIIYQLWKSYPGYRKEAKIQTWMYKVALNTALYFNKKKSIYTTDLSNTELIEDESNLKIEEQLQKLYNAIRRLKNIDRAIILLYLEKKSYLQISEIVGLSEKNISVKLVRIKEKLKKIINKDF